MSGSGSGDDQAADAHDNGPRDNTSRDALDCKFGPSAAALIANL